jgi:hypothetical protein
VIHFAIAEGGFVNFGTPDVGSWERIRKLRLLPQARAPQKRIIPVYDKFPLFQGKTRRGVLPSGLRASFKAADQVEDGAAALRVGDALVSLDK